MVPSFKGFFLWQTIKGDVQLHGIQVLGIELEPPPLRKVGGVEDPVPPVRIVVPARAYEETRLRSRGQRSELFGVQEHPGNNGMKFHTLMRVAELAEHLPVKVELLGRENLEEEIPPHSLETLIGADVSGRPRHCQALSGTSSVCTVLYGFSVEWLGRPCTGSRK